MFVPQLVLFVLALVVYRKRRERGFLFIALGSAVGASYGLFSVAVNLAAISGVRLNTPLLGTLSVVLIYSPLVLTIIGWVLLASATGKAIK